MKKIISFSLVLAFLVAIAPDMDAKLGWIKKGRKEVKAPRRPLPADPRKFPTKPLPPLPHKTKSLPSREKALRLAKFKKDVDLKALARKLGNYLTALNAKINTKLPMVGTVKKDILAFSTILSKDAKALRRFNEKLPQFRGIIDVAFIELPEWKDGGYWKSLTLQESKDSLEATYSLLSDLEFIVSQMGMFPEATISKAKGVLAYLKDARGMFVEKAIAKKLLEDLIKFGERVKKTEKD